MLFSIHFSVKNIETNSNIKIFLFKSQYQKTFRKARSFLFGDTPSKTTKMQTSAKYACTSTHAKFFIYQGLHFKYIKSRGIGILTVYQIAKLEDRLFKFPKAGHMHSYEYSNQEPVLDLN